MDLLIVVRITVVTALFVVCSVLPFLPGRYDALAMPLSLMAQVFGKVGLALVPFGILWLVFPRLRSVALMATSAVWILISIAIGFESISLSIASLAVLAVIAMRRQSVRPPELIVVPVAVALIQFAIADPLTRFSRNRAVRNSARLIAEIERHRVVNGRYPPSLLSVWPDISPSMVGVREYRYELHGEAYNLAFEQPTFRIGTREFVVYNPRGEHAMTSHALDVLQLAPEQLRLERMRGHDEVHDGPQPNWKYFWFD